MGHLARCGVPRTGLGRRPGESSGSTDPNVHLRVAGSAHDSKARGVGDVLSPCSILREVAVSGDHAVRGGSAGRARSKTPGCPMIGRALPDDRWSGRRRVPGRRSIDREREVAAFHRGGVPFTSCLISRLIGGRIGCPIRGLMSAGFLPRLVARVCSGTCVESRLRVSSLMPQPRPRPTLRTSRPSSRDGGRSTPTGRSPSWFRPRTGERNRASRPTARGGSRLRPSRAFDVGTPCPNARMSQAPRRGGLPAHQGLRRSGNSLTHSPADICSRRGRSTAGLHLAYHILWWQPENHHIWPFFQKTGGFLVKSRLATSLDLSSTASGCGRVDAG